MSSEQAEKNNFLALAITNLLKKINPDSLKLTQTEIEARLKENNLSWQELEQLILACQQYCQVLAIEIEIDPQEDPLGFLQRIIEIFKQLPFEDQSLSQKLPQSAVPDKELLAQLIEALKEETKRREKIIAEIRKKLAAMGYSPNEVDKLINQLLARREKEIEQQWSSQLEEKELPPSKIQIRALVIDSFSIEKLKVSAKLNLEIEELIQKISSPNLAISQVVLTHQIASTLPENLALESKEALAEKMAPVILLAYCQNPANLEEPSSLKPPLLLAAQAHLSPEELSLISPSIEHLPAAIKPFLIQLDKEGLLSETMVPEIIEQAKQAAEKSARVFLEKTIPRSTLEKIEEEEIEKATQAIAIIFSRPLPPAAIASLKVVSKPPPKTPETPLPPIFQIQQTQTWTETIIALNPFSNAYNNLAAVFHFLQFTPEELKVLAQSKSVFSQLIDFTPTTATKTKNRFTFSSFLSFSLVAESVKNHPLYSTYQKVVNWRQGLIKKPVVNWIMNQPLIKKIETKFFQFAAKRIAARLAKKGVLIAGEKLTQLLIGEGITAAVAALLGISTAGAAFLLWLAWEAIKLAGSLINKLLKAAKIPQIINWINRNFSLGLARYLAPLIDKALFFLPKFLREWVSWLAQLLEPLIEVSFVLPLIPIFIGLFAALFFFNFQSQGLINTIMPPLERGGQIAQEEFPSEITIEPVDVSQCSSLIEPARLACKITIALNNCFPHGVNQSNVSQVEACLSVNNIASDHIFTQIKSSVDSFTTLQCVGYKRAIEPQLPGCGDAKNFIGCCQHIYSPGQDLIEKENEIQPGDNAVWNSGTYGHIAMVIDTETYRDSGQIIVAQAWGGSGKINFTRVNIAEVSEFIRCR